MKVSIAAGARARVAGNRLARSFSQTMALAVALATAMPIMARADDYPTRAINLIVPFPAGGPTDVSMRVIAEAASKKLGVAITIDNRAGAGGATAPGTMALTAAPDGYTIAQMPVTVFRFPLMQDAKWTPDDFTYISHLTGYVFAVISNNNHPFKTWDDLVTFAKAYPGKLTFGSSGVGGSPHLGMEALMRKAGIKLTHVPFKGASDYTTALIGGHIDVAVGGGTTRDLAAEGEVHYLNVWTAKPVPTLPGVPTLVQLGYGLVIDSPFGVAGPKGMKPEVVKKLDDAFKAAIEDPTVIAELEKMDMVPNYKNSEDYKKSVQDFVVSETALLKELDLYKK